MLMHHNILYILCGIPASGKSTLSKQLVKQYNAKLHCFDKLPKAHHPKYYKEVRKQMHLDIANDLRNGLDIVCDDLHTEKQWREDILTVTKDVDCKKIIIVMTTPLEECLRRNVNREARLPDFVLYDLNEKFEPPTLDEGWDEILYF